MDKKKIRNMHRTYQLLKLLVKYGAFALVSLCTLRCGLLIFGYDLFCFHVLFCVFLFILGICLSYLFDFCIMHKICVLYICTVISCIVLNRHPMFHTLGFDSMGARVIMYALGVFIAGGSMWRVRE